MENIQKHEEDAVENEDRGDSSESKNVLGKKEEEKEVNSKQEKDNAESTEKAEGVTEKKQDTDSEDEQKAEEKVKIKISHLKAGTILKGSVYSQGGDFLFEEYHVFNEDDITKLKESGDENIFYTPAVDSISEHARRQSLSFMEKFLNSVKTGKKANVKEASQIVDLLISDVYSHESGFLTLLELKNYDEYVYVHSVNVGILSIMLAKKMAITEQEAKIIGLGAFLHDVGKINTPSSVIWKIKGDNEEEEKVIHEHPTFGYRVMESSGGVQDEVLNIIIGHHENFDGSGFPGGLKDKSLDKTVKIVSICNYYSSLTEKAEGKTPLCPREAVLQIHSMSGRMFNPMIVKAFINELSYLLLDQPLYPPGSLVLLSTKEIALVETVNRYSDVNPIVRIMSGSNGKRLRRFITVNLKNDLSRIIVKILKLPEPNLEKKEKATQEEIAEDVTENETEKKENEETTL